MSLLPDVPFALGEDNTHYGKLAHKAEKNGDLHTASAFKVAQYITLGREENEDLAKKIKYFKYALEKHAHPKPPIDDEVWAFYLKLQDWIRTECGAEALRLARKEDEFLSDRVKLNELRFRLVSDAAQFYPKLVPADCPDHYKPEDYEQLKRLQYKWA